MKYAVLFFCLLTVSKSPARTLQSLARLSNALLVLTDEATTQTSDKSCGLTTQDLSMKSQLLHALIDEKTEKLTPADFRILAERAATCEQDCTCDIYAYALEKREKPIQLIAEKASKTDLNSRKKCLIQMKSICSQVQQIK